MIEVALTCTYSGDIKDHSIGIARRDDGSLIVLERARNGAGDFHWKELTIPDSNSVSKLEQAIKATYDANSLGDFLVSCDGGELILSGIIELCDAWQIAYTRRESQQNSTVADQSSTTDIYRAHEHAPSDVAARMAEILGEDPESVEPDSDDSGSEDDFADEEYQDGELIACIVSESDLGLEVRAWIYQESDGIADNLEADLVIVQEDLPAFRQAFKEEYPEAEALSDIIDMVDDDIDFLMDLCDRNDVSYMSSLVSLSDL